MDLYSLQHNLKYADNSIECWRSFFFQFQWLQDTFFFLKLYEILMYHKPNHDLIELQKYCDLFSHSFYSSYLSELAVDIKSKWNNRMRLFLNNSDFATSECGIFRSLSDI